MKKLIIICAVMVAIAGGWYWYSFIRAETKLENNLATTAITKGNLESVITAQGKLEPKEYVDVGAQVSGKIEKLHVNVGGDVKKGDLIAEIDPDIYQSQVEGSEARLKTLQAQKLQQEAQVKQAQQKLTRNKKLIDQNAISREAYEDTQTALEIAKAQLASLNAQIEEAGSSLEGDKANLNYTKIYAPMDGTVVSEATKEGQTINASQTAPVIVQVADLDIMTVRAQVAEADISRLNLDMPVYFTTLGPQDRRWNGKIRQILPSPETVNDVVLYNVLIDVENKDRNLMTDMTTQMFFVLGSAKNVNLIPVSALIKRIPKSDTKNAKAYEVETLQGKKHISKTVLIGLSDRNQAEIISGLEPNDEIILQVPETTQSGNNAGGARRMMGMGRL